MLARVRIQGFGPHDDFEVELDPRGPTVIAGPSESGKTTLLDAVLFALWGRTSDEPRFPVERIRDGTDRAEVEVTLDSGMVVRRTMTRERSMGRSIAIAGRSGTYSSEARFLAALGRLGQDPDALRVVVAPRAWVPMVATNARDLRDLLARILPGGDVVAEVRRRMVESGFQASDADCALEPKTVEVRRREARRLRDELTGRAQAERDAVDRLTTTDIPVPNVTLARQVLEARAAWGNFESTSTGDVAGWDRRRAELGDEPPAANRDEARGREAAAREALKAAMDAFMSAKGRLEEADRRRDELESAGDTCPTCGRPGWDEAEDALDRARIEASERQAEVDGLLEQGKAARAAHNEAKQVLEHADAAHERYVAWQSAIRALGPRPEGGGGSAPSFSRPDDAEVADAREQVARAQAAEGARAQRHRDLEQARSRLSEALRRHDEAAAEHARLDALLEAVRAAPSAVLERQAEALGDLGPVSLRFGDNPAVEVLVDGRPWWVASRGRQVVADMWLRAGIRRALDLPWLPLIVDNVQDVGGQELPPVGGPLVVLRTTDDPKLSVKRR